MVQVPAVTRVTVVAATVQTPVVSELNVTVRPEVAVAADRWQRCRWRRTVGARCAPKVMVWAALVTVNDG